MKITYRRDISANYMVIENPEGLPEKDFAFKILENNKIANLLDFDYENINGKVNFLYDISSKQALGILLETEKLSYEKLCGFVISLKNLTGALEEYLLDINCVILKKECIFAQSEEGRFSFCFDPCYNGNFSQSLGAVFDDFLSWVSYEDPEAVKLIYALHKESHKENFTIDTLAALLYPEKALPAEEKLFVPEGPEPGFDGFPSSEDYYDRAEPETEMPKKKPASAKQLSASPQKSASSAPLKKFFSYVKGKSLFEVVDDIDSGQIKKKIKETSPLPLEKPAKKTKEEDISAPAPENLTKSSASSGPEDDDQLLKDTEQLLFEEIELLSEENEEENFEDPPASNEFSDGKRRLIGINSQQGQVIEIDTFPFTIGRLKEKADGVVPSDSVSKVHCRISKKSLSDSEDSYFFEDLNSRHGSCINYIKINPYKKMPLRPGDIVQIADAEYCFR